MSTSLITGGTVVNATGTAPADVLIDGETILMFGQLARLQRIEATVMEKSERPTIDQDVIGATLEPSRVQIPVGDVVRRVAQNGGAREETRYEIDPLLIDEQTVCDVDTAASRSRDRPPTLVNPPPM